jgi:hypothetical protein
MLIESVEEPREQLNGVPLFPYLESFLASNGYSLKKFVRTHMSLEIFRIPYFLDLLCKPHHELMFGVCNVKLGHLHKKTEIP